MVDHNIKIEKKLGIYLELRFMLMRKKKEIKSYEKLGLLK
jgi:hypothetical protein